MIDKEIATNWHRFKAVQGPLKFKCIRKRNTRRFGEGRGGGGSGNSEFEESLHLLNTSDSHCLDKTTKALFKMFLTKPNNVFFLVHTQPGTSEVTVSLKSYSRLCYALVCEISACYIKH